MLSEGRTIGVTPKRSQYASPSRGRRKPKHGATGPSTWITETRCKISRDAHHARSARFQKRSVGARPVLNVHPARRCSTLPGLRQRPLFRRYLKVADQCPSCGEALHHHRADDAPPYFTIVIVGHVVVGLLLAVEIAYRPPLWLHAAIWLPLTVILALSFCRRSRVRWSACNGRC